MTMPGLASSGEMLPVVHYAMLACFAMLCLTMLMPVSRGVTLLSLAFFLGSSNGSFVGLEISFVDEHLNLMPAPISGLCLVLDPLVHLQPH